MDRGLDRRDFATFQADSKDLIAALLPLARRNAPLSPQGRLELPERISGPKREVEMKRRLCQGALIATLALSTFGGAAWAGGSDDFGCSNATLKGLYSFGVTAYTPPPSRGVPTQVVTGIKVFDGQGNLTQSDYQGDDLAGPDFAPAGREKGTYQVSSNCTGSMAINLNAFGGKPDPTQGGVINIKFVISDGGRHIHEVVSEFTPPGSPGPVPAQTSADDWKVASDGGR